MSAQPASPEDLTTGVWVLDPARSSVEFQVPSFWGLAKVNGHFERYEGKLDLQATPAVQLTIDATSLETGNRRRDRHLRSSDFFDVEHHPQVQFTSETAQLDGETLNTNGTLEAGGEGMPVDLTATLTIIDGNPVIEAETTVDRHDFGMRWNFLGIVGKPSTLVVRGNLVREGTEEAPNSPGAPGRPG
jgi:polyisoprenoid-binding protein YceI